MPLIETILSPLLYKGRAIVDSHITIAVDILRATTSLCAAFEAGATEVLPLTSLDELEYYREQGYMLAAERGGKKIGDAECGNSPTEYMKMNLHGKRLAYSTTNGTVAIQMASKSSKTFIGSFANISALVNKIRQNYTDLVILCSGWEGSASLEDTLFCGALASRLIEHGDYVASDDATTMAMELWNDAKDNLYKYCCKATHVHRLQKLHYDHDIIFALQCDTCSVTPFIDKGSHTITL